MGGITKKKVKPTNIAQIVKFHLNTHNIINKLSRQDIGFMLKWPCILKKYEQNSPLKHSKDNF